jgi:hypothetical protein
MAAHWLECRLEGDVAKCPTDAVAKLDRGLLDGEFWGEGALPLLLAHHWYLSVRAGHEGAVTRLSTLLGFVVASQSGLGGLSPLPPPYYEVGEVILHRNHADLPGVEDPLVNDYFAGQSFTAMGLLHLVAQTGAKDEAKAVWRHLTRISHRCFRPTHPWQFCLVNSFEGRDEETILPPRGEWEEIHRAALDPSLPGVPSRLANDPTMLLLFTIVCPHRMMPEVARYLGLRFSSFQGASGLPVEPD